MKAIIKRPGEAPEFIEFDGFNHIKKLIGCDIAERVHLCKIDALNLVMYVDEEGLLNDSEFNFTIRTYNEHFPVQNIMGTAIFCVGRIIGEDEVYWNATPFVMDVVNGIIARSEKEPVVYKSNFYVESL